MHFFPPRTVAFIYGFSVFKNVTVVFLELYVILYQSGVFGWFFFFILVDQ